MNVEKENISPEFSVIVPLDTIGDGPRKMTISASDEERSALAGRFGLVAIQALSAELALEWLKPEKVLALRGRFSAHITQSCVITLDPVEAELDEVLDIVFSRNPADTADIIDPNEAEILEGEDIDVGEIVAEELSLSLNPYPRRADIDPASLDLGPGAQIVSEEAAAQEARNSAKKDNPFEALAALKPKN